MKHRLSFCVLLSAFTATCGGAPPPAPPPPPKSGLDLTLVDKSVRPQDDFFRYVNGGWLAKTEIPAEKSVYGSFTELSDRAEADLRTIIEEAANAKAAKAPGSVAQQVGDFYTAFMNDARADQLGATPIQADLDRIWAIKTPEEFAAVVGEMGTRGITGPASHYIEADKKDPATPIVYLEQEGIALPDRDYYLKNDPKLAETRQKYVEFLQKIFALTGRPRAAEDAKAVMALETALAKIQWTNVDSRDDIKTYNKMAVATLNTTMPGFDWAAWTKALGIDRAPNVIISEPSFFKSFAAMVRTTPLEIWKAWLAAVVIRTEAPYLSAPFVEANFDFFGRTLGGQQQIRPRWKRAVAAINTNMGEAVGKLYVERHFPPAAKARMQQMIGNLLEAYRQSITNLDWMTPETKTAALDKLSKFMTKIAYPDKWRDYNGLAVASDDLVGNMQRASRFEHDYQVAKLGKPVDRAEWLMTPQTVNAYYNSVLNEIVFPAAILQAPFFTFDADDAVNYGGIGAVIGHEIGHGFDDQGRHSDGTGALHDWWTPADDREFTKRAKMLIAQFNVYTPLDGLHVNGALTVGENIGDLGGLSIAYQAYKIALGGKPAPTVDALTGDQRFFMGWAQVWRVKLREAYLRQSLLSDPHAPAEFRVNGPVSNVPGFYDAFGVKPGDKLYRDPKDRVRIW